MNDPTLPTEAEERDLFERPSKAINTNVDCKENSEGKTFQKQWQDGADVHQPYEIADLAGQLLDGMLDIHKRGWTVFIRDQSWRDQYQ